MPDFIPMTRKGYDKKKAEMTRLQNDEMPKIAEKIAAARDEGDLKENAEYHAQRENQGFMQAKINQLRSDLSKARIMDTSNLPKDEVTFGSTILVKDLDYDDEEEFTLVGSGEEDYDVGKILMTSPLGMGFLGKKIGDKVEIEVPKGVLKFEILKISVAE